MTLIQRFSLLLYLLLAPVLLWAQTTMTDTEVQKFAIREYRLGTSQAQIVTKLMQRGVDIEQIRRVKKALEKQIKTVKQAEKLKNTAATDKFNRTNIFPKLDATTDLETDEDDPFFGQEYENDTEWLKLVGLLKKKYDKNDVFGRDIFNNYALSFEPGKAFATPQNYALGPGDMITVDIYGASQRSETYTISPDGLITIAGFGPINVGGLNVAQATARLRATLGQRYQNSQLRVGLKRSRTITINIMGEVNVPGTYTCSAFASVFHALYMAGGINDLGTLRNIKVYRNNKLITVVDIYDYILNGKLSGNIRLADNDVIVVGPYDCIVSIDGKVKRPMKYEMKRNESVETVLGYAGGFTGDAYRKQVRLLRKTGKEMAVFNVDEFEMGSFHINDGDAIAVDSILNRYQNTVEVKGAVFRPGMYELGKNVNSVKTLINRADGLTEQAFTNRAVIHRMKADRTLEVLSIDVTNIMNGTSPDIPLKENDVLFIPSKEKLLQARTVTIHGEVLQPGIYPFADNETIEDLVLQAGGLNETASTVRVDVSRRIKNPNALQTDSTIAQTFSMKLKDGFVVDGIPGFMLQPYDEVYVRRSPAYNEQQNILITGEVNFQGAYTLTTTNERLSQAIAKAGGLTNRAYARGARLERKITSDERLRMETVVNLARSKSGERDTLASNKLNLMETYYVGIELDKALEHPGGDADLVLRAGDKLIIPTYNGTVKISGDVLYPNTVAYEKGKKPAYYINQAGGFGNRAKRSHTYIVYMNGTVARVSQNAKVRPGCEIIVPSKPVSNKWSLGEWLTMGSSLATFATMIATLANIIK